MPQKTIEFWFDFASTYSYVSAWRIESLARDAHVTVVWRPFLLGPIFKAQGWDTSPFNIYAAKGRYMWRDMERRCAAEGLALSRPDPFPQNSLLAARVALAALAHPQGPTFCRLIFKTEFTGSLQISEADELRPLLKKAGLPETLIEAAQTPEIKQALRDQGDEALRRGIFGAPSFTVGEELFWGDDRLEAALEWACNPNPEWTQPGAELI